jgi:sulfite exporter TauE/SafE
VEAFLGSLLHFENSSPLVTIIPGTILGILFLFWGIQNLRGKKAELPMPSFMGKFYSYLWKKLVYKNMTVSKAFFTGLISIFLPCGLLYGIVLAGLALQHPLMALISMFFFWLGTVPSMVMAPQIFQKFLKPFKSKLPKTYAISLIVIGLLTVSFRIIKFNELTKHNSNNKNNEAMHSCH